MNRFSAAFWFAAALLCAGLAGPAAAADPGPGFSIEGQVREPRRWTVPDLKGRSGIEVETNFHGKTAPEKHMYVGVSLADLLDEAKVIDAPVKGSHYRHIVEVTGRDGYVIAVAMGEIDPNLEAKPVLVAYLRDGQPLDPPDAIQLIVPGDHHGARAVRDVIKIEVK